MIIYFYYIYFLFFKKDYLDIKNYILTIIILIDLLDNLRLISFYFVNDL